MGISDQRKLERKRSERSANIFKVVAEDTLSFLRFIFPRLPSVSNRADGEKF